MSGNTAMVSEVSICNQALSWLGQESINSLDQNSTQAEWMRNNYGFLRDAVLEDYKWTFAEVRLKSTSAELSEWGTTYRHVIPLNWVKVYRVFRDVSSTDPNRWIKSAGWRRVGDSVETRESVVYLQGLLRVTDARKFTPMFVQALAARIAADAAVPFTENRQLQVDMWGLYGDKLANAASSDGQQGDSDKITQHQLTDVRWGGGR